MEIGGAFSKPNLLQRRNWRKERSLRWLRTERIERHVTFLGSHQCFIIARRVDGMVRCPADSTFLRFAGLQNGQERVF